MAKKIINIGQTANDKSGDPLRTAFGKVNDNFTELYSALGADIQIPIQTGNDGKYLTTDGTTLSWGTVSQGASDRLTANGHELVLVGTGPYVTFPEQSGRHTTIQGSEIAAFGGDAFLSSATEGVGLSAKAGQRNRLDWYFDTIGTINTPLLFPLSFTAVLDVEHRTSGGNGTYTGPAWEFNLEWQVSPSGQIELFSDTGPLPSLVVGYADGQTFEFTEEDHGIPNYTLTVTLYNVVQAGPAGWTANLSFSEPPVYPSTVESLGAIKLTSNNHSWTFGTDGTTTFPQGSSFGSPGEGEFSLFNLVDTDFAIYTNNGTNHSWLFGNDGNLTLPDGGIIKNYDGSTYGGSGASVTESDTAPISPNSGDLWYDTVGGRMYVYFDSNWVDTNPIPDTAPNNLLVNGDYNFTLGVDGTVNFDPASNGKGVLQTTADLQFTANTSTWTFGTDGNLTLPNGVKFDGSEGNTFALNSGTVSKIDLRDDGGRGFYTDNGGFIVRGNGTYGWAFGTDGTLTVPGNIESGAGVGPVVIEANDGTARTWTFGGDGTITFPDATVQTTAYRVMSLPPLTAWGTVVSFDNLSFSFDATTGSPGFNGGYGQGSGSYSTLIWTADLYQQLASPTNLTISSGEPVQYFNYNGPNLITEVALTPGDSFVLRIQDVDTNRVYRATFLASFKAADAGNEGKYGAITVERLS